MPAALERACSGHAGRCRNVVIQAGLCGPCNRERQRGIDRSRGSSSFRGYGRRWQAYRQRFLARYRLCGSRPPGAPSTTDSYCQASGYEAPATVVDHIIPVVGADDPAFWVATGHQALCVVCHDRKRGREAANQQGITATSITVICGPPGCGKSSYVAHVTHPGDLIVDLDAICVALSGTTERPAPGVVSPLIPFAAAARDAVIARLKRPSDIRHAWVLTTATDKRTREQLARELGARVLVFEVPAEVCADRIRADPRRTRHHTAWIKTIEAWWRAYERLETDHVMPDNGLGTQDSSTAAPAAG